MHSTRHASHKRYNLPKMHHRCSAPKLQCTKYAPCLFGNFQFLKLLAQSSAVSPVSPSASSSCWSLFTLRKGRYEKVHVHVQVQVHVHCESAVWEKIPCSRWSICRRMHWEAVRPLSNSFSSIKRILLDFFCKHKYKNDCLTMINFKILGL